MKFIDPKSDFAFKKIFGNSAKKEILISFLNATLELPAPIKNVEIISPYQPPIIKDFKDTSLDVKATDSNNREFIVEMQVEGNELFGKRALYYLAKSYVGQIKRAEDYKKLKSVYFIGILNFNMFDGESVLTRHILINQEENRQDLKDFELNFIELKKFNKNEKDLKTVIDKWIFFIKNAENLEVIPGNIVETEIVEAFDSANEMNWTKKELDAYDYWSGKLGDKKAQIITAENKGRREGREEGREEQKLEIAKNMKKIGISIDKIIDATGLNEKKIKDI